MSDVLNYFSMTITPDEFREKVTELAKKELTVRLEEFFERIKDDLSNPDFAVFFELLKCDGMALYSVLKIAVPAVSLLGTDTLTFLIQLRNWYINVFLYDSCANLAYEKYDSASSSWISCDKRDRNAYPYVIWGDDWSNKLEPNDVLQIIKEIEAESKAQSEKWEKTITGS